MQETFVCFIFENSLLNPQFCFYFYFLFQFLSILPFTLKSMFKCVNILCVSLNFQGSSSLRFFCFLKQKSIQCFVVVVVFFLWLLCYLIGNFVCIFVYSALMHVLYIFGEAQDIVVSKNFTSFAFSPYRIYSIFILYRLRLRYFRNAKLFCNILS